MKLPRLKPRRRQDPTIALINIVFLLLVFFLVAGTMAPPLSSRAKLAQSAAGEESEAQDALVILASGELLHRGSPTQLEAFAASLPALPANSRRLLVAADRELPAQQLLEILATLKQMGRFDIHLVIERQAK